MPNTLRMNLPYPGPTATLLAQSTQRLPFLFSKAMSPRHPRLFKALSGGAPTRLATATA